MKKQLVLLLLVLSCFATANATSFRSDSFDVYEDTNNILYFLAKKKILLIASSISIPIPYFDSNSFTINLNDSNPNIQVIANNYSPAGLSAVNGYNFHFGDFNGDGATDLYLHPLRFSAKSMAVVVHGSRSLSPGSTTKTYYSVLNTNLTETEVTIVDINADGKDDIILTLANGQTTPIEPATQTAISKTAATLSAYKTGINASVTKGGAARVQVEIATPTGATGLQAPVSLYYDSQVTSGVMGLGWNMASTDAITRCRPAATNDGVLNYDNSDAYCLGGQRLIAIAGANGKAGTLYRAEVGGDFVVESFGSLHSAPSYWQATYQDGSVVTFGGNANARLEHSENNKIVVRWAESKRQLVSNASYSVSYLKDAAIGEHLVQKIDYTDQYASVQFDWTLRADPFHGWIEGRKTASSRKLSNIYSYSNNALFRHYKVNYGTDTRTNRPLVNSIQECVAEGNVCLDPIMFFWEKTTTSKAFSNAYEFRNVQEQSADVNNDGYVDFFGTENNQITIRVNRGDQSFTTYKLTNKYPSKSPTLADLNVDGYQDVVIITNSKLLVWLGNRNGSYSSAPNVERNINFKGYDDGYTFQDLNGDGRAELITNIQGGPLYIFEAGSNFSYVLKKTLSDNNYAGVKYQFADLNNDGLVDILKTALGTDSSKSYIASDRNFGYKTKTVPNLVQSQTCGSADSYYHPKLNDLTKDGVADLINHVGNELHVYQGLGNGNFSAAAIDTFPIGSSNYGCEQRRGSRSVKYYFEDGSYSHSEQVGYTYYVLSSTIVKFQDLDGNGYQDIISQTSNSKNGFGIVKAHYIAAGEIDEVVTLSSKPWRTEKEGTVEFFDANNDGQVDACTRHNNGNSSDYFCAFSLRENSSKLVGVVDGHAEAYEFDWSHMRDASVYSHLDYTASRNQTAVLNRQPLVKALTTPEGKSWYKYAGAVMSHTRSGYLGFRSFAQITDRETIDGTSQTGATKHVGIITVERLNQSFPFVGRTDEFMTRYVSDKTAAQVYANFTFELFDGEIEGKYAQSALSSKNGQVNYRVNSFSNLTLSNGLMYPYTSGYLAETYAQGSGSVITRVGFAQTFTPAYEGAAYARLTNSVLQSDGQTATSEFTYGKSGVSGTFEDYKVKTNKTTYHNPDATSGDIVDSTHYSYDSKGRVKTETQHVGDKTETKTSYTYSGPGTVSDLIGPSAIVSEASAATIETLYATKVENTGRVATDDGYQAPRIAIQHYSPNNQFKYLTNTFQVLDSDVSAPSDLMETTYSNFDKYGNSRTSVSSAKQTSTATYNALGTQTTSTDGRGNVSTTTVALCSVNTCLIGGHAYSKTSTVSVTSEQLLGTSFAVLDKRGNSIAQYRQLPTGSYSIVQKAFDRHNRMVWEAAPQIVTSTAEAGTATYKTRYEYDVKDRIVTIRKDTLDSSEDPDSTAVVQSVKKFTYAASGNGNGYSKTTLDANGRSKIEIFNGRDKLTGTHENWQADQGFLVKTKFLYDAKDRLIGQQYPKVAVSQAGAVSAVNNLDTYLDSTTYDDANGTETESIPDRTNNIVRQVNVFGELVRIENANSQDISYRYDNLGRVVSKNSPEDLACWYYDNQLSSYSTSSGWQGALDTVVQFKPGLQSTCPTATGLNVGSLNANSTVLQYKRLKVNSFGQPIKETQGIDGKVFVTEFEYDSFGRQTTVHYPTADISNGVAPSITNVFNNVGFVTKVLEENSDPLAADRVLSEIKVIDAYGNTTEKVQLGSTIKRQYSPASGRMQSIEVSKGTDAAFIKLKYGYNLAGEMTQRVDYTRQRKENYSYNDGFKRQLTSVIETDLNGANAKILESISYDPLGNIRVYMADDFSAAIPLHYFQYNGKKLTNVTYTAPREAKPLKDDRYQYDNAGNVKAILDMAQFDHKSFTYRSDNRLASMVDPRSSAALKAEYLYDEFGSKTKRTVTSLGQIFHNELNVVETALMVGGRYELVTKNTNGVTETEHRYYIGDMVITQNGSQKTRHAMIQDHLGSLIGTVRDGGVLTAKYRYSAFGRRLKDMTTVPRIDRSGLELTTRYFTGQERIKGSDFTHMGGRVLNNSTGRFIQADILNFDPTSTISYSRYAYVLNSPYSYTDPTGYAPAHAQLAHEQEMAAQASSNPTTTASAAVTPSSSRVGDTVKGFALNAVYASGGALQAIGEGVMETTEDIVANSGIYANNTAQTIIDFPMYFLDVGLLNFIGLGTGADTRIWGKMTATASSLGYEAQRIKQAAASVDYRAFGSSVIGLGLVLNPRNLIRSSSVGNGYGVAKKVPTDPPIQQMNPKNLIPTQTKNEISGSQVKRLKKDMQKNGFDQSEPIDVVKNARGRLEIEDGHHRTEAAIKAGLDKVPVRVWE